MVTMGKCKEGEIYFAPKNKCVPKMDTKPTDMKETATYGAGAIVLGALAGWVLGKASADDDDVVSDIDKSLLINEYHLNDFIPNIQQIPFDDLDGSEIESVNYAITVGLINRLSDLELEGDNQEHQDSPTIIFDDLQQLQKYVENEGQEEDAYDNIVPIVNHIQDLQQVLNHFDYVDEIIEYLAGEWE